MSIYTFLGDAIEFPMAPYFLHFFEGLNWRENFRAISKAAYDGLIEIQPVSAFSSHLERAAAKRKFIFSEEHYLDLNADVANAVDSHQFSSGLHHYLAKGIHENRSALFSVRLEPDAGAAYTLHIVPPDEFATYSAPDPTAYVVTMVSLTEYSSVTAASAIAKPAFDSLKKHVLLFGDSWLTYDAAWHILQAQIADSKTTTEYLNSVSI